ncbi:MAG: DUF2079 domain-containing protein, partial [Chloroflexi bacterium]|nr:DUF2079 domain-containing protein [Chloroflexota bacterium]
MTVSAAPRSLRAGSDLAGVLQGLGAAALRRELRAPPLLVLVAGMAVYAAVLTRLALVKHHTFNSAIYDLGIFDQVIWNSANGRPFATSIFAQHSLDNYLGEHTSPILLLFVPLYWLHDGAETLLVTQTLYIAAAALPIYLLGRLWLGSAWSATALALSYLLQTHVTLINLFDFHPDTLQLLFVPLLFYGFHAGRPRLTLVVAAASLAVKEDAGLFVAAFGIYAALHSGRRRLGLALILAGALWFALSIYVVIPALRAEPYVFLERFEEHGGTPVEIALKLLGDPAATAALILTPQKLEYVVTLLRGLGFTPLLGAPVLVATAPQFFGNLVSNSAAQWHLSYQYTCIVVATFAVAAVRGLEWVMWATGWLASRAWSSGVRLARATPLLLSLL